MKSTLWIFSLPVMLLSSAFAHDLNGSWSASFAGNTSDAAQQFGDICLDLEAKGPNLNGLALVKNRGVAQLTRGKIEGNHFSFTVATYQDPAMSFEGTINGKQLNLTLLGSNPRPLTGQRVESKVVAPVSVNATAADLAGNWKAWFVGRFGDRPKMFGEVTFDLKVDGTKITGNAHMGNWPGDAAISDGRFEGGHFFFTATGKLGSSSGIPVVRFEGTLHGREMKVALVNMGAGHLPMDGAKLSTN